MNKIQEHFDISKWFIFPHSSSEQLYKPGTSTDWLPMAARDSMSPQDANASWSSSGGCDIVPAPAPVNSRAAAIHTAAFSSLHVPILGNFGFSMSLSPTVLFLAPPIFLEEVMTLLLWKFSSTSQGPTARQHRADILMTIACHQLLYQYEFHKLFVKYAGT